MRLKPSDALTVPLAIGLIFLGFYLSETRVNGNAILLLILTSVITFVLLCVKVFGTLKEFRKSKMGYRVKKNPTRNVYHWKCKRCDSPSGRGVAAGWGKAILIGAEHEASKHDSSVNLFKLEEDLVNGGYL
jgi:hypothetical protein